MGRQLKICWYKIADKGSVDRIPFDWFKSDIKKHDLVHDVYDAAWPPRSKSRLAKCDVECKQNHAYLTYHDEGFNRQRDMLLGTLHIEFVDVERTRPITVQWKGEIEPKGAKTDDYVSCARFSVVDDCADDIESILADSNLSNTVKQRLINARLGQGEYRDKLIGIWSSSCAVTGIRALAVLRASHIKPWCQANNRERLDPSNGLLLSANIDALFDRHLITFDADGVMGISHLVPESEREKLLLADAPRLCVKLTAEQERYMAHHRGRFLEQ